MPINYTKRRMLQDEFDRSYSAIMQSLSDGLSPDDLQKGIRSALSSFFENLEPEAIPDSLISVARNLSIVSESDKAWELFTRTLDRMRQVISQEPVKALAALYSWLNECTDGDKVFQTTYYHQQTDENLLADLNDFAHYVLKFVGTIIEDCMQPYLKMVLHVLRIERGTQVSKQELHALKFGTVVSELDNDTAFSNRLAFNKWTGRLSDWRNIAHHYSKSVEVIGDSVVCTYGQANSYSVTLTRDDLYDLFGEVQRLYFAVKEAHFICLLDYNEKAREYGLLREDLMWRKQADADAFRDISEDMMLNGLQLLDLHFDDNHARAIVQAIQPGQNKAPQETVAKSLLFRVWWSTKSKIVSIEYRSHEGKALWEIRSKGKGLKDFLDPSLPTVDLKYKLIDFVQNRTHQFTLHFRR